MAVVDMPLEKLRVYEGINPKPGDFDEYWERALRQMRAVEPKVETTGADFQCPFADCYDMYYTGVNDSRIYAKLAVPKSAQKPMPGLLCFHGYGGSSGDWCNTLPYAAAGFVVASMDCRGQGGKSQDNTPVKGPTKDGHIIRGMGDDPEKLMFRQIFLDSAQLAGLVMQMDEVDENRVGAIGGSQGGGLTIACAALEPRIKKAAPVFPFLSDYKRFWQLDLETSAYAELKQYFRLFDPLHEREDELFTKLGYIDVQHLAPRIKAEVLMGITLRDDICPPSTQFAVYNRITSKKKMAFYHDFGHENLPGMSDMHFQFMLELVK